MYSYSNANTKLDNSENRSSSSTIKSEQHSFESENDRHETTLEKYDTIKIRKIMLNNLREKYGVSCLPRASQEIRIKIIEFNKPVKDIIKFIRNSTNIDLLKKPLFSIDDER
jgi:hypothetical protein